MGTVRPAGRIGALLLAAAVLAGCTTAASRSPAQHTAASTGPVPRQAPWSRPAATRPPRGLLAFDCPRPAGAAVVFCTAHPGGAIRRVAAPALGPRAGGACCPRWSPDGQRLLVRLTQSVGTLQRGDIGMVNADGSGLVNLSNRPDGGNWGATWSPDGTRIVFNSAREPAAGSSGSTHLWVMNADGSGLRQITEIWGEYPAWSPDGTLIAFQSNRCACNGVGGQAEYDIYTVRPDGTGLRRLTTWPGEEGVGGWSPDGTMLAYGRNPDVWPGIWIMTRDGTQVTRLQPAAPQGVQLRGVEGWAPDGSFIVYGIRGDDPQTAIGSDYWVSPDGRSVTLLQADASGAEWRPAGAGKLVTRLQLAHHWVGGPAPHLELAGRLTAGGRPAVGRRILVGRLGESLPTERLGTPITDRHGAFSVRLRLAGDPRLGSDAFARSWRAATAFYPGSDAEWSTAAFEPLRPGR